MGNMLYNVMDNYYIKRIRDMKKTFVLYNPLSCNGQGKEEAKALDALLAGETLEYVDVCEINDYAEFFAGVTGEDKLVLCGGDGTINQFVRRVGDAMPDREIYYFATGTGNDFWTELGRKKGDAPVDIAPYLKGLPTVTVKGETYPVLNGVGFGIDGYCCEIGDQKRAAGVKKINYAGIAVSGLLFHYPPKNATVIVDGKEYTFQKVWIAPTMYGKYYGGGMNPAPNQVRGNGKVSVVVMHKKGRLGTLLIFPSIFKGEHVKHTDAVAVMEGKEITVKFDKPAPLQIDGETILNVSEYTVKI